MKDTNDRHVSTYQLCQQLGVSIKVKDIKALGFLPDFCTGNGTYWDKDKIPQIKRCLATKILSKDDDVCGFVLELETGMIDGVYYGRGVAHIYDVAKSFDALRPGLTHIPCVTSSEKKPTIQDVRALNRAPRWGCGI